LFIENLELILVCNYQVLEQPALAELEPQH